MARNETVQQLSDHLKILAAFTDQSMFILAIDMAAGVYFSDCLHMSVVWTMFYIYTLASCVLSLLKDQH